MFALFCQRVKGQRAGFGQSRAAWPIDLAPMNGHDAAMLIYKIFRAPEWEELQAAGETRGAPVDLADGFIHFSTAEQAQETARRHFAGAEGLILAAIDTELLAQPVTWEKSRGGADFPHLYGVLPRAAVVWARPLPLVDGAHVFPAEMT